MIKFISVVLKNTVQKQILLYFSRTVRFQKKTRRVFLAQFKEPTVNYGR